MTKSTLTIVAPALLGIVAPAYAQRLHVVRAIPGYRCMSLNLTESQLLNNSAPVPVRSAPSSSAPQVGVAGATVAVASPLHPVNGYLQMMFPNGAKVWIAADRLRPWRSPSNPQARCTPALLSNGKPGFDYR